MKSRHLVSVGIAVLLTASVTTTRLAAQEGDILPLDELRARSEAAARNTEPLPPDAKLLARLDLGAMASDPRLAALGLDGLAKRFGIRGADAAWLGGDAKEVAIAGWPQADAGADAWDIVLSFNGSFEASSIDKAFPLTASSKSVVEGLELREVAFEGAADSMFLHLIDEERLHLGTAEGLRRWMQSKPSGTGPSAAAIAANAMPARASGWVVLDLALADPAAGAAGQVQDVRGLSASVTLDTLTTIQARLFLQDAERAQTLASSLQMLPLLLASGADSSLAQVAGKLQSQVEGRDLVASLSLEPTELVAFRAAVQALAGRFGAPAAMAQPGAQASTPASGAAADGAP